MPFVPPFAALVLATTVPSAAATSSASPNSSVSSPQPTGRATRSGVAPARAEHSRGNRKEKASSDRHHRHEKDAKSGSNSPLPPVPTLSLRLPSAAVSKAPASRDDKTETHSEIASTAVSNAKSAVDAEKPAAPKALCLRQPVLVQHGSESLRFSLTRCDGSATPRAVESLSVLARSERHEGAHGKDAAAADRAPRLDRRLLERLQLVVDHFEKDGKPPHVVLVSSPEADRNRYGRNRALDYRVEGVSGEDLLAYCHTIADTACGYYPQAGFVHMEVREKGAGRVAWVDASETAYNAPISTLVEVLRDAEKFERSSVIKATNVRDKEVREKE